MTARIMSPADLVEITGKKRYVKQAEWFKDQFGVPVSCRADGSVVMPWATYEALAAKKAGLTPSGASSQTVELCYD